VTSLEWAGQLVRCLTTIPERKCFWRNQIEEEKQEDQNCGG